MGWLWHAPSAQVEAQPVLSVPQLRGDVDEADVRVLDAVGQGLARVITRVTPSVVHIQSERVLPQQGRKEEETGSGVIVTSRKKPGYFVVTNRHVIEGANVHQIAIQLHDGREVHPVRIWSDAATDLAVLQLDIGGLQAAEWADSNRVEIGHLVLAVGSPFGLSRSVTLGIISAKGRRQLKLGNAEVLNQDFLQTDAAINPGNSGGPLMDVHGRIVGINTAIASSSGGNEGIGFSIPSNLAQTVMEQLLEHGTVRRGYLGVKLDPQFTIRTAQELQLDRVRGARVTLVYPNTPAARANLQVNDVILSFDGIEVQDENHLINLVSLTPIGRQVRLEVWRGGKLITITITLADRAELEQTSQLPPQPGMGHSVRILGITVHPVDQELARVMGYPATNRGLMVLKIEPHSSLAGRLQVYDVIEAIEQMSVTQVEDLYRALATYHEAESLRLMVRRGIGSRMQRLQIPWQR
ncbi:MAG: MucD protein [Planctomycetaceae bacterium]|nr:MAG: MucD protein [Planctomycetaceae bacterium]